MHVLRAFCELEVVDLFFLLMLLEVLEEFCVEVIVTRPDLSLWIFLRCKAPVCVGFSIMSTHDVQHFLMLSCILLTPFFHCH